MKGPGTKCQNARMVIPIQKIPFISIKADSCVDDYWKEIAILGNKASVILKFPSATWLPCIIMLRKAGIDVYIEVNARKSQFSKMETYFQNQIKLSIQTYKGKGHN
jgi:protein associated with RNAse G/E